MAVDPYRIHRGAILEEVILYILSRNGYLPVVKVNAVPLTEKEKA